MLAQNDHPEWARPLRRIIQRYLREPLADRMLADDPAPGTVVTVDAGAAGLVFDPPALRRLPADQWGEPKNSVAKAETGLLLGNTCQHIHTTHGIVTLVCETKPVSVAIPQQLPLKKLFIVARSDFGSR